MNLINKVKDSKFFKSVSYVLAANIVSQIESFAFVILAAAMFSVDDYGTYTLLMSILYTVIELSDLGMNSAVVRFTAQYHSEGDEEKEAQIIALAFKRKMRSAIFVTLIMSVCSVLISKQLLRTTEYWPFIVMISIGVGFALINTLNNSILQGRHWYKKYFYSISLSNVILFILILIALITDNFTIGWILAANVINFGIAMIISYFIVGLDMKKIFSIKVYDEVATKKFKNFGGWMLVWSILFILQSKIDVFMLGALTTTAQVSYYDMAMKISRPFFMIFNSYGQVLNPLLSTMKTKDELHQITKKTIKFVSLVSVLLVVAMLLSKFGLFILFGEKYMNSVTPLIIVLFSMIVYVWTMPFNSVLYTLNKPYIFTVASAIGLVVTIIGNVILLPKYGAVGAAITYLLAQIISLLLNFIGYKYYINKIDLE